MCRGVVEVMRMSRGVRPRGCAGSCGRCCWAPLMCWSMHVGGLFFVFDIRSGGRLRVGAWRTHISTATANHACIRRASPQCRSCTFGFPLVGVVAILTPGERQSAVLARVSTSRDRVVVRSAETGVALQAVCVGARILKTGGRPMRAVRGSLQSGC